MARHHGDRAAEIRRAAHRLIELEILDTFVPDDDDRPTEYVAVTSAQEMCVVTPETALAYLRGLGQGAHAVDVAYARDAEPEPDRAFGPRS